MESVFTGNLQNTAPDAEKSQENNNNNNLSNSSTHNNNDNYSNDDNNTNNFLKLHVVFVLVNKRFTNYFIYF